MGPIKMELEGCLANVSVKIQDKMQASAQEFLSGG